MKPSEPLLLSNTSILLWWLIRLRLCAVVGQAMTVWVAIKILHIPLPASLLVGVIGITVLTNVGLHLLYVQGREVPRWFLGGILAFDVLLLTLLLGFSGGPTNPFSTLYLVHVVMASVILGSWWAWIMVLLTATSYALLFRQYVPIPHFLEGEIPGIELHLVGLWIAYVITAMIIVYFQARIRDALQSKERELALVKEEKERQERLLSLSTLAAGAAHELGTPLGTIAVVAGELSHRLKARADTENAADSDLIRSEVKRCRAILDRLIGRSGENLGERIEPAELAQLLQLVERELGGVAVRVLFSPLSERTSVRVPQRLFVESIVNMVRNALDASNANDPVSVTAESHGGELRVTVTNRGAPIPAEVLERIGQPFFTTKPVGKGMGLGTFLIRSFAKELGGSFVITSRPEAGGGGTTSAVLALPGVVVGGP